MQLYYEIRTWDWIFSRVWESLAPLTASRISIICTTCASSTVRLFFIDLYKKTIVTHLAWCYCKIRCIKKATCIAAVLITIQSCIGCFIKIDCVFLTGYMNEMRKTMNTITSIRSSGSLIVFSSSTCIPSSFNCQQISTDEKIPNVSKKPVFICAG